MDEVRIRARRAADVGQCVRGLRAVHDADGYPMSWPADPVGWLTRPAVQQAWIAELADGVLAGHVALQRVVDALYESAGWRYTHTTVAGRTRPSGKSVHLRHYVL
jgi:hypothetical protein